MFTQCIRSLLPLHVAFVFCSVGAASNPGDSFFNDETPAQLQVTVATNYYAELNRRTGAYVPAVVRFQSNAVAQVGLRLRGFTSFQPIDRRPALALKFTDTKAKSSFGGLSKLLVNNCANDSCCMREQVACSLFRAAGIAAARARPIRVTINGRDIGICLAIEAMNKDFLRQHFGDASGVLYEGVRSDIDQPLELDNGTDDSGEALHKLIDATQEREPARRLSRLSAILDVDGFLKFAAVQVLLGHSDGYLGNRNNYRIYRVPSSGRFVFIPHGLDTTFMQGASLTPSTNNLVMNALYSVPEIRRRYASVCDVIVSNLWNADFLGRQIERAGIAVQRLGTADVRRLGGCGEFLSSQVFGRRQEALAWLSEPEPTAISLAPNASASLSNWISFIRVGTPTLDVVTNRDGSFLRIVSSKSNPCGWRCRTVLPAGQYQFSSRVLARSLPNSNGNETPSLLMRIAGAPGGAALVRTGEWQALNYSFTAPTDDRIVEFLCELQGGRADIWIDRSSLKISRVQ